METQSVMAVMLDWSLIWVVPALGLAIMALGACIAVLWMFRERR